MQTDRYGNELATSSAEARDHYIDAVDKLLSGEAGNIEAFQAAIAADPGFALGHSGLARAYQMAGDFARANEAITVASGLTEGLSTQTKAHIAAFSQLIGGKAAEAYPAIRAHAAEYPRDVLIAQTCAGVFGLIGFSGQPGRESEQLAFTASLAPHYGDDWWFSCQHAFSMCEVGQLDQADKLIDQALAAKPRSPHSAHVRAHVYYEAGEAPTGIKYLEGWLPESDPASMLHSHISWHLALWKLGAGEVDSVMALIDEHIVPEVNQGFPLIVLCDYAAILYRMGLAGVDVPAERWRAVAEYAHEHFPRTGLAFADVHAAVAYAMAGDGEALSAIIANPKGPAGDVVKEVATAFQAIAAQNWREAADHLAAGIADHARIGGSRAQRDLLDHAMLSVMLRLGEGEAARRFLAARRPVHVANPPVAGLAAA